MVSIVTAEMPNSMAEAAKGLPHVAAKRLPPFAATSPKSKQLVPDEGLEPPTY